VVREPFEPCSHCKRLNKECKIDLDFKRVAKRESVITCPSSEGIIIDVDIQSSQLEHLNRQIRDLRQQLELAKRSPATLPDTPQDDFSPSITSSSREQTLGDVLLPGQEIANLFDM